MFKKLFSKMNKKSNNKMNYDAEYFKRKLEKEYPGDQKIGKDDYARNYILALVYKKMPELVEKYKKLCEESRFVMDKHYKQSDYFFDNDFVDVKNNFRFNRTEKYRSTFFGEEFRFLDNLDTLTISAVSCMEQFGEINDEAMRILIPIFSVYRKNRIGGAFSFIEGFIWNNENIIDYLRYKNPLERDITEDVMKYIELVRDGKFTAFCAKKNLTYVLRIIKKADETTGNAESLVTKIQKVYSFYQQMYATKYFADIILDYDSHEFKLKAFYDCANIYYKVRVTLPGTPEYDSNEVTKLFIEYYKKPAVPYVDFALFNKAQSIYNKPLERSLALKTEEADAVDHVLFAQQAWDERNKRILRIDGKSRKEIDEIKEYRVKEPFPEIAQLPGWKEGTKPLIVNSNYMYSQFEYFTGINLEEKPEFDFNRNIIKYRVVNKSPTIYFADRARRTTCCSMLIEKVKYGKEDILERHIEEFKESITKEVEKEYKDFSEKAEKNNDYELSYCCDLRNSNRIRALSNCEKSRLNGDKHGKIKYNLTYKGEYGREYREYMRTLFVTVLGFGKVAVAISMQVINDDENGVILEGFKDYYVPRLEDSQNYVRLWQKCKDEEKLGEFITDYDVYNGNYSNYSYRRHLADSYKATLYIRAFNESKENRFGAARYIAMTQKRAALRRMIKAKANKKRTV